MLWDWASSSSLCWSRWSPARTQKVTGCLGEEGLTGCLRAAGPWLDRSSRAGSKTFVASLYQGLAQGKWKLACSRARGRKWTRSSPQQGLGGGLRRAFAELVPPPCGSLRSGELAARVILGPLPQPCSALLSAAPGDLDTYWSGTAPICLGGCKGKHKELKRSQCGNGSCCWLGYKSFCRGTARGERPVGPWGWLQGLAQPAWEGQVLCHAHVCGVSPEAKPWSHKGTQPGAPAEPAQHPGPRPGPATLSGCIALGCHSAEQAAQGASPALPTGTSLSPVNCGRPKADFNSVVYGNDWWVGSVVRYSCRPGFLLLGDPASACQPDGHWTPKPTCLREYCWMPR